MITGPPPKIYEVRDILGEDTLRLNATVPLGQLASQLADRGCADIVQDPTNRRAKVIRCTARGKRARSAIRAAMAAVEARWRNEVGEERYTIFREVLDQLGHQIGELPAQPSPTGSMTPPPNMPE